MSFMIMYNYATVIDISHSMGVTISFCKFWFENEVRCCHLLAIWYVFIVDMLFSFFFFDSAHDKIYVDIYLKIFWCILVLYTHQI